MGYVRPKHEQLDRRLSRRAGMTLSEILVTMAVVVVVLAIISILTSSIFSVTGKTQALMEIDEQMSNIQSRLKRIISQSFTSFAPNHDPEAEKTYKVTSTEIELYSYVPLIDENGSEDPKNPIVSRIWYDGSNALYYSFPISPDSDTTQLIAEHLADFSFDEDKQYVYYSGTLRYRGIEKDFEGVVRFY